MNNDNKQDNASRDGKPFLIVGVAVVALIGLSLLPWGEWTDNIFKNFSLFSDLFPGQEKSVAEEIVDPELAKVLDELDDGNAIAVTTPDTMQQTTTDVNKSMGQAEATPSVSGIPTADQVKSVQNNRVGDNVVIEDYTINSCGAANLRRALVNRTIRPARIAVIGDSYIEGDILTMNLRADLQDYYGGTGVGYMPLHSDLVGFRTSVKQKCSGWTAHDIRKNCDNAYKWLSGEYFVSSGTATTSYKGSSKLPHLSLWSMTKLLFVSPKDAKITISTDTETKTYDINGSPDVQCLSVSGTTSSAEFKTSTPGVVALGAYLDGSSGVQVDCMSLRGNSGISHRQLNLSLASQLRQFVNYDMIIVEYGINALTSQQSNYNGYKKLMINVVKRLKACYPNADILIMGIGDRGQKIGSTVKSIPTAQYMVNAQRDVARETGTLFWDTREAMGGEDAVIEWREKGMINPDYIHLNAKGGKALGALLFDAIKVAVK